MIYYRLLFLSGMMGNNYSTSVIHLTPYVLIYNKLAQSLCAQSYREKKVGGSLGKNFVGEKQKRCVSLLSPFQFRVPLFLFHPSQYSLLLSIFGNNPLSFYYFSFPTTVTFSFPLLKPRILHPLSFN